MRAQRALSAMSKANGCSVHSMRASERSELAHDTVIVIEPGADYLVGFM